MVSQFHSLLLAAADAAAAATTAAAVAALLPRGRARHHRYLDKRIRPTPQNPQITPPCSVPPRSVRGPLVSLPICLVSGALWKVDDDRLLPDEKWLGGGRHVA